MFCAHAHPSIRLFRRSSNQYSSCSHTSDNGVRRRTSSLHFAPSQCEPLSWNKMSSLRERNLNRPRAMADSGGVTEQSPDLDDTRKEVFLVAAESILREDVKRFDTGANGNGAVAKGERKGNGTATKTKEKDIDWEKAPTIPDELEFAQRHPLDPHKPNFSELLPEPLRPYPSFEGWFVRIWDPTAQLSAAVILATNYATDESQVTLLFAPGKNVDREGSRDGVKHGYTYAVAVKTKVDFFAFRMEKQKSQPIWYGGSETWNGVNLQDAKFMKKENNEEWGDERGEKPEGFEWEANGIGRFIVTPHTMDLDFTVEGYHFNAHLTKELLWDAHISEKGPEGWIRYLSIISTHWYVFSLGSAVDYTFSNPEKQILSEGSAFGHVEKNWGQTFPAGHVWLQAFSSDNASQVCFSGAYFKTPDEKLNTPYLFVLGYRSAKLQLDFRTNDLGIVFKDVDLKPLDSSFSIKAVGPSHTVELKAFAPYDTFSDTVLAPVSKVDWEPACRESFVATAEINVYEHLAWGIPGTEHLVETQKFEFAGLEFGEDLLSGASESGENRN